MKPQPQFLTIRWEETPEQGSVVTLGQWRACGAVGKSRWHTPRLEVLGGGAMPAISAMAAIPDHPDRSALNSHRSQLGSPDGKPGASGRPRRPAPSNKSGIGALLQAAL